MQDTQCTTASPSITQQQPKAEQISGDIDRTAMISSAIIQWPLYQVQNIHEKTLGHEKTEPLH
eukprot:7569-Heterococcus_DN1.PRE.4